MDAAATCALVVSADDAIAGAVTTPDTQTATVLETPFGPAPAAAEKVVYVTARGDDDHDGSSLKRAKATLAAAIAEAGDYATRTEVGAGTFEMEPDIQLRSSITIQGLGANTILTYSGSRTAIGAATPDVRTYRLQFRNVRLTGPGKATAGTVSINWPPCPKTCWRTSRSSASRPASVSARRSTPELRATAACGTSPCSSASPGSPPRQARTR